MIKRRIAVLGAGAIGGVLAARLALAGHEVAVLARGAHGAALARGELVLEAAEGRRTAKVEPLASASALKTADIVFLCVKASDVEALMHAVPAAIRRQALIVPVLNGLPFWYRPPGFSASLATSDPGGVIARLLTGARIIGAVAHLAAEVVAPGVVRETAGGRLLLGPAQGVAEADCAMLGAALAGVSGLDARIVPRIEDEIWIKLVGNAGFNPVSALTGATMAEICADEALLATIRLVMAEVMAVGERCGIAFPVTIEQRIAMARRIGGSKLSMLQDLERGRPVESDALLGTVSEIGARHAVPTPTIDTLRALVSMRAGQNMKRKAA